MGLAVERAAISHSFAHFAKPGKALMAPSMANVRPEKMSSHGPGDPALVRFLPPPQAGGRAVDTVSCTEIQPLGLDLLYQV